MFKFISILNISQVNLNIYIQLLPIFQNIVVNRLYVSSLCNTQKIALIELKVKRLNNAHLI